MMLYDCCFADVLGSLCLPAWWRMFGVVGCLLCSCNCDYMTFMQVSVYRKAS